MSIDRSTRVVFIAPAIPGDARSPLQPALLRCFEVRAHRTIDGLVHLEGGRDTLMSVRDDLSLFADNAAENDLQEAIDGDRTPLRFLAEQALAGERDLALTDVLRDICARHPGSVPEIVMTLCDYPNSQPRNERDVYQTLWRVTPHTVQSAELRDALLADWRAGSALRRPVGSFAICLDPEQWEMYTCAAEPKALWAAADAINAALTAALRDATSRQAVRYRVHEVMSSFRKVGAYDTEPRRVLETLLDRYAPNLRQAEQASVDVGPARIHCEATAVGIVVDIYRRGRESDGAIASAFARRGNFAADASADPETPSRPPNAGPSPR